jgi:hypothetical protein
LELTAAAKAEEGPGTERCHQNANDEEDASYSTVIVKEAGESRLVGRYTVSTQPYLVDREALSLPAMIPVGFATTWV